MPSSYMSDGEYFSFDGKLIVSHINSRDALKAFEEYKHLRNSPLMKALK